LKAFEERMGELTTHPDIQTQVSYRRAIQLQVQRYKKCVMTGAEYEPFLRK
jgi:CRISP-associated protein Cas1